VTIPKAVQADMPTLNRLSTFNAELFDLEAKLAEIDERCADFQIYEPGPSPKATKQRVPLLPISSIGQEPPLLVAEDIEHRRGEWQSRKLSLALRGKSDFSKLISSEGLNPRGSLNIQPKGQDLLRQPEVVTRAPSSNVSRQNSRTFKNRDLLERARKLAAEVSPSSYVASSQQTPTPVHKVRRTSNEGHVLQVSPFLLNASSVNDSYLSSAPSSGLSSGLSSGRSSADSEVPLLFTTSSAVSETEHPRQVFSCVKRSEIEIKQTMANGNLQVNQYMLEAQIGKGSFGVVYSALDTVLGERRAVKVFDKKQLKKHFHGKNTSLHVIRNEIETMSALDHPNIIKTYEVMESSHKNSVYLVVELASNGTLNEVCPMSENDAWNYFRQLVAALDYLHNEAKVVHRDIKPQNLLLDSDYKLKLIDFGTAQSIHIHDTFNNVSGSHAFMSPELVTGAKPFEGRALDVWAAGVTLYYFIEGCTPFASRKILKLYEEIASGSVLYPPRIKEPLKSLLVRMLTKDPKRRIKLSEIKDHPWFMQGPSTDIR
jgi:[calcium/calmodulin-dependent protein kinase] kinase